MAVWAVYGSTYVAKNSAELISKDRGVDPFWPVFWAPFLVNMGVGIMKDRFLAKMFGTGGAAPNFPGLSYIAFAARDSFITMASFNGPRYVGPLLTRHFDLSEERAKTIAQLACPAAAQV